MLNPSQTSDLSEYIGNFIEKAKDSSSGLSQINIPESLQDQENLNFRFKTSFGQGQRTHTPWLACLGKEQGASVKGVYPVILFRTETSQLFVTYGISVTANETDGNWPTEWPKDVVAGLPAFPHGNYESARVLKQFDCSENVNPIEIANEFLKIINIFHEMLSMPNKNSNNFKMSSFNDLATQFFNSTNTTRLSFSKSLLIRLLSSQTTKPFTILTGLSGSGKTKLAEAVAHWLSEKPDEQICMVAVGADWTNNEPLLGYADALHEKRYSAPASGTLELLTRAIANPKKPHFLILDEMNLSHVERYFADFLSAMESSTPSLALHGQGTLLADNDLQVPARLPLSPNVFIIGTVNVDETTYMFSPKVLDRANVIEFRVAAEQMASFLDSPSAVNIKSLTGKGAHFAEALVARAQSEAHLNDLQDKDGVVISEKLKADLMALFEPLTEVGAEFGYRSAKEISRFFAIHHELSGENWLYRDALDAQVMQKLMPKLHGSARKLSGVLDTLEKFANTHDLPLTKNKVARMKKRLKDEGFTSFVDN